MSLSNLEVINFESGQIFLRIRAASIPLAFVEGASVASRLCRHPASSRSTPDSGWAHVYTSFSERDRSFSSWSAMRASSFGTSCNSRNVLGSSLS